MTHQLGPSADNLTLGALGDRIRGSLATAMIGDALGAPTEQRSIPEIRQLFGGRVEAFFAAPPDAPYAKGALRTYAWAGSRR
jgi:ADP-ribosylglycohydrolase